MKKLLAVFLMLLALAPIPAAAVSGAEATAEILDADVLADIADIDPSDDQVYRLIDTDGRYLTSRASQLFEGDEYISGDNKLYRVISVDDGALTATAEYLGYEPENDQAAFALMASARAARAEAQTDANKRINMYSTHSDESYVPTDGESSKVKNAGIYDVGEALKKNLEALGIEVTYSQDTFLPHDAGAYRRSRGKAMELLKEAPAALLDLHRDGIPDPKEYETKVDGEEMTKVRLLVGKSNANSQANRAFAKEIKAKADKEYPGLIKDIYIGKGNYNQELYPKALLIEFGTHTTEKESAIKSSEYLASVLNDVLFGGTAKASGTKQSENSAGGAGIAWIIGAAVLAAVIYILAASGSFKTLGRKLTRGASEVTGGMLGRQPDERIKGEDDEMDP